MQRTEPRAEIPMALLRAREQLFWDRSQPAPAIGSTRFALRVMELGTWEMMEALQEHFPKSVLIDALEKADYGALSRRSWNFWCLRLGVDIPYPRRFAKN